MSTVLYANSAECYLKDFETRDQITRYSNFDGIFGVIQPLVLKFIMGIAALIGGVFLLFIGIFVAVLSCRDSYCVPHTLVHPLHIFNHNVMT